MESFYAKRNVLKMHALGVLLQWQNVDGWGEERTFLGGSFGRLQQLLSRREM